MHIFSHGKSTLLFESQSLIGYVQYDRSAFMRTNCKHLGQTMAYDPERNNYNRRKCSLRLGYIWKYADCRSSDSRNRRWRSEYVSVRGDITVI